MTGSSPTRPNAEIWPHRMAWVLGCGVFASIVSGGFVTTYRAGMTIPDWPHTFGYPLVFYPLGDWLAEWDLFVSHGHRLIGIVVEVLAVVFSACLWRFERRRWVRGWGLVLCVTSIVEGLVGGLRILENETLLAMVHACISPLFFLLSTSMIVWTSPAWRRSTLLDTKDRETRFGLALIVAILVQIVLGALLRHLIPAMRPLWFTLGVWSHLIVGSLVLLGVMIVWLRSIRRPRVSCQGHICCRISRESLLALLAIVQVLLGLGTWLVRYGFPAWFSDNLLALGYTVVSEGRLQVLISTTHMVFGTLTLVTAWSLVLWSRRLTESKAASLER